MAIESLETIAIPKNSVSALSIQNFAAYSLSPLRYPGGKTWFTNYSNSWLAGHLNEKLKLVEPFAGGASVSLSALQHNLVQEVQLFEIDGAVASFWKVVISREAPHLTEMILEFRPTIKNITTVISSHPRKPLQIAFQTLIRNRFLYGGILAKGAGLPRLGENSKGVTQRWYPETLVKRILGIYQKREQISISSSCGLQAIQNMKRQKHTVFFIDPPYVQDGKNAGRRIYSELDVCVFRILESFQPSDAKFLLTYHQSREVAEQAISNGFDMSLIPMKNAHHEHQFEMVITNDHLWEETVLWSKYINNT